MRSVVIMLGITGLYFAIPMTAHDLTGIRLLIRGFVLVGGLPMLTWLVGRQVQRAMFGGRRLGEQLSMLLTLICVVVTFFASMCFILASQFNGIQTKLDALYFAVATLCTVGYGDITPTGQTARAVVIVQMLFNLVIVTSAVSIIITAVSRRVDQSAADGRSPHGGSPLSAGGNRRRPR
jgi:hypothetical protein